jgi:hypothetical protein
MSELIELLKDKLFDGKKSFFASFVTSWTLWNWEVILLLFSGMEMSYKIWNIKVAMKEFSIFGYYEDFFIVHPYLVIFINELVMPFVIASLRYILAEDLQTGMEKVQQKFKNFVKIEDKIKIENEELRRELSSIESKKDREIQNLKKSLDENISKHNKHYATISNVIIPLLHVNDEKIKNVNSDPEHVAYIINEISSIPITSDGTLNYLKDKLTQKLLNAKTNSKKN